ncbi:uncharacterized protein [Aristolochia californica]|uniref:uncharacterized protein n=1 Tax=Aristolochia californica TaxID=171875 RepID=UPI0035DBD315
MEISETVQRISMSPKEAETSSLVSPKHINRRSTSFCGSPSSSISSLGSFCSSNLDSPLSPISPLQFLGVPFKWEQQPGIPKQLHSPKHKSPARDLLPLPPAGASSQRFISIWRKKTHDAKFGTDPFVAALLECSKPDEECWKSSKVSRTLSDRFGFGFIDLYGSCKSSCSVMESKVLIPRSSRSSYHMLSRRIG